MATLPFIRLSLAGNINGAQSWSCGMSFGCPVLPGDTDLFAWLTTIGPLFNTWSTAVHFATQNNGGLHATNLIAYGYDAGAVHASVQANQLLATPITGGGTNAGDWRQCVNVGFYSGRPGRSGRGRMFVPWTGVSDAVNNQLSPTDTAAMANGTKALVDSITTHPIGAIDITPVIASRGSNPYTGVTTIVVDSLFKTQRRRTNKIASITSSVVPL
jgi:hypothetical protein